MTRRQALAFAGLGGASLVLAACANQASSSEESTTQATSTSAANAATSSSNEGTTTSSSSEESTATPSSDGESGTSSSNVDFQTGTYTYSDDDGYQFQIRVKVSPWILQSNTDAIEAAWAEVGKDNELPTLDDWGLTKKGDYYQASGSMLGTDGTITFESSNLDMYYVVGTFAIKNATDGFDVTSSNKRSFSMWGAAPPLDTFLTQSSILGGSNSFYDAQTITKVFYTDPKQYLGEYLGKPSLTSNSYGPVTFVIARGETTSPNYPDGKYYEQLKNHSQMAFCSAVSTPSFSYTVTREDKDQEFTYTTAGDAGPGEYVEFTLDVIR